MNNELRHLANIYMKNSGDTLCAFIGCAISEHDSELIESTLCSLMNLVSAIASKAFELGIDTELVSLIAEVTSEIEELEKKCKD